MAKVIEILGPLSLPTEERYFHREPNHPLPDNVNTLKFTGNFDPLEDVAGVVETPDHVRKERLLRHHLKQFHNLSQRIYGLEDTLRSKNPIDDNIRDGILKEIEELNEMRELHRDYLIQNDHLDTLLNDPLSTAPKLPVPLETAPSDIATLNKKQQYGMEFTKYLSAPESDREEAKRVLNDVKRWKNPSAYLRPARKELTDLSVQELKSRPCFGWIDPKGTSKD